MKKKRTDKFFPLLFVCSLLATLWPIHPLSAQDSATERRFPNSKAEVDQAIQELHGSLKGRLPTLEGFVEDGREPVDHFDRGFYECVTQVGPDAGGQTLVRIAAKITAWYTDPAAARSGYRVLASNGRIETDLLDQLDKLLAKKTTSPAPAPSNGSPRVSLPAAPKPAALTSRSLGVVPAISPVIAPVLGQPTTGPTAAPSKEDLNALALRREQAEKRAKSLRDEVQNLEEILRNQSHPDNLAVVRQAGTPILAKPGGAVLLTAEAKDEFEVIGLEGNWVHVQISGASRGWIQRAQLDLPEGFVNISKAQSSPAASDDPAFRVIHEDTHPFTGNWPQLLGKTVRIIWVEPATDAGKTTSGDAKRKFAKSEFVEAFKQQQSSGAQLPGGVVIIFDAADGGQVSVSTSNLAQWQAGQLSEDSFWKQCLVEPPEMFQSAQNP
jgi:hypothetical protein